MQPCTIKITYENAICKINFQNTYKNLKFFLKRHHRLFCTSQAEKLRRWCTNELWERMEFHIACCFWHLTMAITIKDPSGGDILFFAIKLLSSHNWMKIVTTTYCNCIFNMTLYHDLTVTKKHFLSACSTKWSISATTFRINWITLEHFVIGWLGLSPPVIAK